MNQKYVLITGASRGIGRACALLFARNNYHVFSTADILWMLCKKWSRRFLPHMDPALSFPEMSGIPMRYERCSLSLNRTVRDWMF